MKVQKIQSLSGILEHTDNENSGAIGTFCLKMKQRKGEIDTIKVE